MSPDVLSIEPSALPFRIGVIADTHGLLRPEALAALAGSDLILHAGDVGKPEVLAGLRALAPLVVVRGNVDRGGWALNLPECQSLEVAGQRLLLLHNIAELPPEPFAIVVCGHSHKPRAVWQDGTLYFNPGSAGPRRFRLPVAVGRLEWAGGEWRAEIVELPI
jgi:putative phosphoesterase